ncbi:hypothetical protein DPMN_129609 [Dreissena polymorpha]|uniref:Uncharacterized protein n=1 Tax=Dreissena polymorpha TaxID=45954 RepID=A0A9D4H646_DREPO|nr:hypothetical protein DPMN_129609 [Dreissena polymorpha]
MSARRQVECLSMPSCLPAYPPACLSNVCHLLVECLPECQFNAFMPFGCLSDVCLPVGRMPSCMLAAGRMSVCLQLCLPACLSNNCLLPVECFPAC